MNGKIVIFFAALLCQIYAAPNGSCGEISGGNSETNLEQADDQEVMSQSQNLESQQQGSGTSDDFDKLEEELKHLQSTYRDILSRLRNGLQNQRKEARTRSATTYKKFDEASKKGAEPLLLEVKERVAKLGDWIKDKAGDEAEKLKTFIDKLKAIAKKYREEINNLHEDVVREGEEYIEEYKSDLKLFFEALSTFLQELIKKASSDDPEDPEVPKTYQKYIADLDAATYEIDTIAESQNVIQNVQSQAKETLTNYTNYSY